MNWLRRLSRQTNWEKYLFHEHETCFLAERSQSDLTTTLVNSYSRVRVMYCLENISEVNNRYKTALE